MAIGNAVQRGSLVYAYDEHNRLIFTRSSGNGPHDGLKGYTSRTLNIRIGSMIYTYDARGKEISSVPAR